MRRRFQLTMVTLILILLGSRLLGFTDAVAQGRPERKALVVIVAADSKLRDISHALLRRIFLGEPTEYEGQRWVPFNYGPDDALRVAFDELALRLSKEATGRYWVDRRIRGQGLPPRAIATQTLLRAVVARLPGAIGYITADQLNSSVRALTIDGVAHDRPGYRLR
jgi:GNAT superfamily N-acetyltransferase